MHGEDEQDELDDHPLDPDSLVVDEHAEFLIDGASKTGHLPPAVANEKVVANMGGGASLGT